MAQDALEWTAMPPTLIADAGTPLMWAGFAHLTIGNLLIGLLEAGIVRWRFAASKSFASI
jgi:hypothetical protein